MPTPADPPAPVRLRRSPGAVRERGTIFTGESVRQILAGAKTMTRRVMNPQPPAWSQVGDVAALVNGDRWAIGRISPTREMWPPGDELGVRCSLGSAGTKLWVKEKFVETCDEYGTPVILYAADGAVKGIGRGDDDRDFLIDGTFGVVSQPERWTSPLFMPRWASRLTLEVSEVRVERLNDISEADARAEGCDGDGIVTGVDTATTPCRSQFIRRWSAINAKQHPWASNCWVWVVSFKVVPDA